MKVNIKARLLKKEQLKPDIFKFSLKADEIVRQAKPGNFIEVKVSDTNDPFLRRPISIYNLDKENGILEIIFQVKGTGTDLLSKKLEQDEIDIIGPLGYGTFKTEGVRNVAIIGGGIGTYPLYELAKTLKKDGCKVHMYLGFRNKEYVTLEKEYTDVSDTISITTDDGSYGIKGFAIDILKQELEKGNFDMIYSCGPLPMLRALQQLTKQYNIPCQVSLEEKMGCGIGACLGCAVNKISKTENIYVHVCKLGPVFMADEVEI